MKYAAFLRAINVGGNRLVKMETLIREFESLKFKNVKTYIQSGNILFETAAQEDSVLSKKIEKQLFKTLGFEVPAIVRSAIEIENIIENNPFKDKNLSKDLALYIALLSDKPDKKQTEALAAFNNGNENFIIIKKDVYCLINKKVKTLFSNNWVEKILKTTATTRNITTILKLKEMLMK
jgi:uncharacterized protein (DUF1697 family)